MTEEVKERELKMSPRFFDSWPGVGAIHFVGNQGGMDV